MLKRRRKAKKGQRALLHGRLRMYKTCNLVPLTPERQNW